MQGDPAKKKKRAAAPLTERFYSSSASDWKSKFDEIRKVNVSPVFLGQGALTKNSFDVLLSGESPEKCSANGDDGYLKMDISGTLHEQLEFGYTFVGTISPTFSMQEAYGYYDTNLQLTGALNFNGKGYLSVPAGMAGANFFTSPVSAWGFSHPGICNFGPWVNVEVQMIGEGEIDGDFTANFIIGNDGVVSDSLPTSTGGHSGDVSNALLSDTFSGALTLPSSSASSNKKRQSSGIDGTVLGLRFLTTSQMKLDLHFYGLKEIAAAVEFNQSLDSYLRINRQSNGSPRITFSNQQATIESFTQGDLPWGDDDVQSVVGRGNALVLHDGGETPAYRNAPTINGYALFGGHDLMDCSNSNRGGASGLQGCLCMSSLDQFDRSLDLDPETGEPYDFVTRRRRRGSRMSRLRELDPTLDLDPETGKPYEEGLIFNELEARTITYGAPVPYNVHGPSGNTWQIVMNRYPNGQNGASLQQLNPNAGRYGSEDCRDCENVAISSVSDDPDLQVVTEHIHERQTEPRAQEYMMTGSARRGDGTLVRSDYNPVPERYLDQNSYLFQDYGVWDPNGPYTANGRPIDEITNAYGSDINPGVLVNADSVMNGYKARAWVGHQLMGNDLWTSNGFDIADSDHAEQAISTIRTAIQILSYLNDDDVNNNWATVINNVVEIYRRYQERVLAVDGVQLHAAEMYQEYVREVVLLNLENNIESWVARRIRQLRNVWYPLLNQDPWAEGIIATLDNLREVMESILLDTTRMDLGE